LLRAHGGFLLLHLRDLLSDEPVWEKLRRFMRNGRLQIEEPGMMLAPVAAVSLEPEAVDLQVKIVLIASVEEYYAVQAADPEFARRFRCKVDFVESFVASAESAHATAIFVAHTCARLGLLHCAADAVAALIEETHRQAQDQARQSARFALCEALVVESCDVAKRRAASLVHAADVQMALLARMHRCNYPEQRLQESMVDGERLVVVQGERVAQVNGLTVVDLGDYSFGFPVRVTARSCAGEDGLLNIEREVEMSGPIHDKGVLILHSHLSALFGHIAPLALNAALVFEQEYGGVEGDSASCAEFYALLSSLADAPIRQGIAVTGAMNQHGEILPVGGINEKIEGYFRCCELLGLDGQQGVLMPARNLRHLMLDDALVQAVAQGRFHIHTAHTVAEGMTLLTGLPFGDEAAAAYGADTVLGRAQKKLLTFRQACMALHLHAPTARRQRRARTGRA
jgi:predicted ATP-dependent protease